MPPWQPHPSRLEEMVLALNVVLVLFGQRAGMRTHELNLKTDRVRDLEDAHTFFAALW